MASSCADLVHKFHNLNGTLIGERKKNFQLLLRSTANAPDLDNLTSVLQQIEPTNFFETLLKVDMLIFFKRTPELMEILRGGNEILISKILKCPWFFEAFKGIDSEELVNEIFPHLSFSVRMQVLRRLSNIFSESEVDNIFDAFVNRYGLFVGSNILSNCTSQKIEEVIKANNNLNLNSRQLISIFEKDRSLLEIYLTEYQKNNKKPLEDNKLFKYIANKDMNYFYELKVKFEIFTKLGRRMTKKLVDHKKNEIISKPDDFIKIVRRDTFTRKLKGDYKQVFFKLFPRDLHYTNTSEIKELLKYYPQKHKYTLYNETFTKVFNKNIWDYKDWLDDSVESFISGPDREKWAEMKYKKEKKWKYLKYYALEISIPLLKEKINLCNSLSDRGIMLVTLIKSCAIHKNLEALEDVLKYICARHRNESSAVLSNIMVAIQDEFDLKKFNETHWKYIAEIIHVQHIKKYYCESGKLKTAYMEFLYNNNKPIKDEMMQYLQDLILHQPWYFSSELYTDNIKLQREALCLGIELIPLLQPPPKQEENFIMLKEAEHVSHIQEFNEKHPDLKMDAFKYPRFIESSKSAIKLENHRLHKFIIDTVIKENKTEAEKDFLRFVVDNFKDDQKIFAKRTICDLFEKNNLTKSERCLFKTVYGSLEIYDSEGRVGNWLITNAPTTVLKNFDTFPEYLNDINDVNRYRLKKYSNLNLDAKAIEYGKKCLDQSKSWVIQQSIRLLSILMQPEDYIEMVTPFIPTSDKIETDPADDVQAFHSLQNAMAREFKNIKLPIVFSTLFKFCKGDFLTGAIQALYPLFHRIPENDLLPLTNHLSKGAVSLRKHALFLACCALNQQKIVEILTTSAEKEKNLSGKKNLFSCAYKYFLKNPSDEYYNFIKSFVKVIDKSDDESLKLLANLNKVPHSYKSDYFQLILGVYEELEQNGADVDDCRKTLLNSVDENVMRGLPSNLCKSFIEKYFLQIEQDKFEECTAQFVLKFLQFHEDQKSNFEYVFDIVKGNWNTKDRKFQKTVTNFFSHFRQYLKDCNETDNNFIAYCTHYFNTILNPIEAFEEYVYNQLIELKRQTLEPFVVNYTEVVIKFLDELISSFGISVLDKFVPLLETTLTDYDQNKFLFSYNILQHKISTATSLLVLGLFTGHYNKPSKIEDVKYHEEVIKLLQNFQEDHSVQLHLNLYLKSL